LLVVCSKLVSQEMQRQMMVKLAMIRMVEAKIQMVEMGGQIGQDQMGQMPSQVCLCLTLSLPMSHISGI
jgi:hypothetical protein